MYLRLDFPTVYRIQSDEASLHSIDNPRWMKWGWCRASEMLGAINKHYGLKWNIEELLDRFALNRELVPKVKIGNKFGLRVLIVSENGQSIQVRNFSEVILRHILFSKPDFFVPAGWAKEVLWALYSGGRKLAVRDGVIGVHTEDDQPIYIW